MADPSPALVRNVRSLELPAGTRWWRGTTHHPSALVPGLGDTRFAPLPGTAHAYFGGTKTVALLETALHDAAGASPVIYLAQVRNWSVHELELTRPLRLADLRNHELDRLSLARHQLVDTTAAHYPCTRRWAASLHGTSSNDGGHHGIIWHSRQAELYGQINPGSLLADVVHHVAAEVAVLWSPPAAADPFVATGASITLVDDGAPTRFLEELAFLVGASFE